MGLQIGGMTQKYLFRLIIALASFALPHTTWGQYQTLFEKLQYQQDAPGQLRFVQSNHIEKLVERHLYEKRKKPVQGYRIRVFADSGPRAKKQWEDTYNHLRQTVEIPIYRDFDYPQYKLYVGDFRTHSEAYAFKKQIEKNYPDAFVVESAINISE